MIRLERVSRVFRVGETEVRALDDVSEHIAEGEHVALMGPSGSGKSTLLNVLGCLDRPSAGSYRLDGREVAALDDAELTLVRRRMVGFVFQSFHLVPRLSAVDNVELPLLFAGVERAERRARAAAELAAVGMQPRMDHRPDQLSGGERQRVAIARAIVNRPAILFADEPTGNLDSRTGAEVLGLLRGLGTTLLVITHDREVADALPRRVEMRDGRVVADDAPERWVAPTGMRA